MILVILIAVGAYSKRRSIRSFNLLFFGTALWVFLTLVLYIGKIERISQRAAISFWEDKSGQDVYVATYDYKSYADLFYSKIEPKEDTRYQNREWLFKGAVDKPVYISCKVTHKEKLERELEDVVYLYNENGFYFYLRNPE